MPKIVLETLASNYASITQLNANFEAIETILNNNVLFRDNIAPDASNPNQMENDLDMNSYCILNLCDATQSHMAVNLGQIQGFINRLVAVEDTVVAIENELYIGPEEDAPLATEITKPTLMILRNLGDPASTTSIVIREPE